MEECRKKGRGVIGGNRRVNQELWREYPVKCLKRRREDISGGGITLKAVEITRDLLNRICWRMVV